MLMTRMARLLLAPMSLVKKRILVPVDFSECSIQALHYAVHLAEPLGAQLIVLHVVEPILHYAAGADILFEEQLRSARHELSRLLEGLGGVKLHMIVQEGSPYRAIADAADRLEAELIVMGTHGRKGVSRLFVGSVAERVLRMATCPVLTVGARKRRGRRYRATRRRASG
jgi:nucleotide-binding universal stress UspA family protein